MNVFDRFTATFAPRWTLERVRARAALGVLGKRTYDAAQPGRRTSGWTRNRGDPNSLLQVAGAELRMHARDLLRNNGYARKAQNIATNNTVGWGIIPKANGTDPRQNLAARAAWVKWAGTTDCDADGRLDFAGLQALVMRSLFADGEVLVRRRHREPRDGLALPIQLQVLEADFLDTNKSGVPGIEGGPIVSGVEFDAIGRRVAYWLFPSHPGSTTALAGASKRIPARDVRHIAAVDRPGQVRGASWLASAIVPLKDLDEYEDAELVKQKIAACFAAFVTDEHGTASPVGLLGEDTANGQGTEQLEPGMISHLPPGRSVVVASPPQVTTDAFTVRNLRRIAAGIGVSYEDLTGDYSQVNFSSARMGRIVHQGYVRAWQSTIMIPQFCGPVWAWAMEAARASGVLRGAAPGADWTSPPLPMLEPDKEGLAYQRLIRVGVMTPSDAVREQGADPEAHWDAYAADMAMLDAKKIRLDSDVRAVSQAGLTQERVGSAVKPPPPTDAENSFEITDGGEP